MKGRGKNCSPTITAGSKGRKLRSPERSILHCLKRRGRGMTLVRTSLEKGKGSFFEGEDRRRKGLFADRNPSRCARKGEGGLY